MASHCLEHFTWTAIFNDKCLLRKRLNEKKKVSHKSCIDVSLGLFEWLRRALPLLQQQSSALHESAWLERPAVVFVVALWVCADDVVTRETTASVVLKRNANCLANSIKITLDRMHCLTCVGPGTVAGGRLFPRRTFSRHKCDSHPQTSPWAWWHHGMRMAGQRQTSAVWVWKWGEEDKNCQVI